MSIDEPQLLPREVITIIINNSKADQASLSHLCLVSRFFNKIATPLLYNFFRGRNTFDHQPRRKSLNSFLRTVLQRPSLGRHVTGLHLDWDEDDRNLCTIPDPALLVLCEQRINELRASWSVNETTNQVRHQRIDHWIDDIEEGKVDGIIALLLCSLPNIQRLFFLEDISETLCRVLRAAAAAAASLGNSVGETHSSKSLPFSKLQSVRTTSRAYSDGWLDFEKLHGIFNIASVREFEIILANGDWLEDDFSSGTEWPVASRSSAVERLSFQASSITEVCLRTIINSCANLKEFYFTQGRIQMHEVDFTPAELLRCLLPHSNSLKVLVLNCDDDWYNNSWERRSISELSFNSDLQKLSHLQRLSINFSVLFGYEESDTGAVFDGTKQKLELCGIELSNLIPDSLEQLEIVACDSQISIHLRRFAKVKSGNRFNQLQAIQCIMIKEATDAALEKVDIPGVDVQYVFATIEERQAMIYAGPGCSLHGDVSMIFTDDILLQNS